MNNFQKSSREEIRERFDHDVERFSNLETGQQTVIDARLCLDLITEAAAAVNPDATDFLDIGCGAGNYTIEMLNRIPALNCTLIDLSMPMLQKAAERVREISDADIDIFQNDILDVDLPDNKFDIILAGAVLHHLRKDEDWKLVFQKIYHSLKPGGSFWICDLIIHDLSEVNNIIQYKYGGFLENMNGKDFKEKVLDYIEKEDSPRSLNFQTALLKEVGFRHIEILHKNLCFAAFGGIR